MKPFVVGLLAFALLIGPQSGFAHFSSHSDPDDTPGRRFDIRLVELQPGRRADGTRVIFLDIWTWGSFTEGDFETRDHTRPFFVANLDTRGNRDIDFNVLMGANDKGPYCQIQGNGKPVGNGTPEFESGHVGCRFARKLIRSDGTHIRWKFLSASQRNDLDYAPDRGWFVH